VCKDVETYFTEVAQQWDEMRAGYFGEHVAQAVISAVKPEPSMTVADIGTGTGYLLAGLAPRVRRAYGFDASFEMLAVARSKQVLPASTLLCRARGSAIPLSDSSLDVVVANMYLHHCADPQAAVREMVRLLRSGGRLVLTDMDEHCEEWMREEMADVWLGFPRHRVQRWFEQAGLREVTVDCAGGDCCATSRDGATAEISIFLATGRR